MDLSLLTHRAGQIRDSLPTLKESHLANELRLLVDIEFTCPTTITNILLGANVLTVINSRNQYPSILLVRETSNRYTVQAEQTIYYTTENISTNGVYNYSLNPPMSVSELDIIAIQAPEDSRAAVTIHYTDAMYNTVSMDPDPNDNGRDDIIYDNQLVLAYPIAGNIQLIKY